MKTAARGRRTQPSHGIPLDLQMMVRLAYSQGWNYEALYPYIARADALVSAALGKATPGDMENLAEEFTEIDERDRVFAEAAIVHYFKSGGTKEKCTSPDAAADELLCNLAYAARRAGFAIGLCAGYRLAKAGHGGAR